MTIRDWHQIQAGVQRRKENLQMQIDEMKMKMATSYGNTIPWPKGNPAPPSEVHEDWTKNYKEVTDIDELAALLQMNVELKVLPEPLNIYTSMPSFNNRIGKISTLPPFLLKKVLAKELEHTTVLVEVE